MSLIENDPPLFDPRTLQVAILEGAALRLQELTDLLFDAASAIGQWNEGDGLQAAGEVAREVLAIIDAAGLAR